MIENQLAAISIPEKITHPEISATSDKNCILSKHRSEIRFIFEVERFTDK